jgi:hypothetical protein
MLGSCYFFWPVLLVLTMDRPLRVEFDGALYHGTSRSNARADIVDDDQDRQACLAIWGTVAKRCTWLGHASRVRDTHDHMGLETPEGNLSTGRRPLNGLYPQAYHRRHRSVEPVVEGRDKARLVQRKRHLLAVCRYVGTPPAGLRRAERTAGEVAS